MFRPVACAAVGSLPAVQNPEHLLIFAAGNDGDIERSTCTVGSPAIGKNVLSVGASSAGDSRWTFTAEDGDARASFTKEVGADIDTVAFFSSYGPTTDNRIKPELVAPGDGVRAWGGTHSTEQSGLARVRSFLFYVQYVPVLLLESFPRRPGGVLALTSCLGSGGPLQGIVSGGQAWHP